MEKKGKITLPIKVIIIGCIIGLVVAGIGLFKQIDSKRINEERRDAALKQSQAAVDAGNARLKEIEKEYNEVKSQYDAKSDECSKYVMGSGDGWVANSIKCQRELSELNEKIGKLKNEDSAIKNRDYTVYYQKVSPMSYQIFYIIGASIAGVAVLGAFIIYLVKGKKTY